MSASGVGRLLTLVVLGAGPLVAVGVTPSLMAAQDIEVLAQERGLALPPAYYALKADDPSAFEFRYASLLRAGTTSIGTVTLPVVLALFADSEEPAITEEMIDRSLFTGPAPKGTITEAYLEMSRGALTVHGDVFPWTRSTLTMAEVVGDSHGLGGTALIGEYLVEALAAVDGDVDWTLYDNDGPDGVADSGDDDGFVDVVTFEFLEIAASCGGPAIWPHRWRVGAARGLDENEEPYGPYVTDDVGISGEPILVQDYIIQSVTDCTGASVQDASTIAHEFGHALGLPDYYHPVTGIEPEHRRWVMGCWALMAGGAWGCGRISEDGGRGTFGPTHMMAHSKEALGWLEWVDPGEVWNQEIFLDPVQASGEALRIPMGDAGTEFLLVEYRTQEGFDDEIPAGGVLMYKLDTSASRRPDPTTSAPYFLTLLEQDGDGALVRTHLLGGDRGVPGDAWGVDGAVGRLNGDTSPSLRMSAGGASTVAVHEVAVVDGRARLVVSTGRTPRLVEPGSELEVPRVRTFTTRVRIAGGRAPYQPQGPVPAGFQLGALGDELLVTGSLVDAGPLEVAVTVRDADGGVSNQATVVLVAPGTWTPDLPSLLEPFLLSGDAVLTPGEESYLDAEGNANGRYDVGDLRRWLREGGSG